jgi:hypothetical protein
MLLLATMLLAGTHAAGWHPFCCWRPCIKILQHDVIVVAYSCLAYA